MKQLVTCVSVFVVLCFTGAGASAQTFAYLITAANFRDGEPNPSYSSGGGTSDVYCGGEAWMSVTNITGAFRTCYPYMSISPQIRDVNNNILVVGLSGVSFTQALLPPGGMWSGIYYSDQCHRALSAGSYTAWIKPVGTDNKSGDATQNYDLSTPVTVN